MNSTRIRGLISAALAAVVISAVFARCASLPPAPGTERFYGTWEWVSSVGSIAGIRITPTAERMSVRYRFEPDRTLAIVRDGSVAERTRFTTFEEPGRAGAPPRPVIRYDEPVNLIPPPQSEQYFRFEGTDTLVLSGMCADCFEHTFVRMDP